MILTAVRGKEINLDTADCVMWPGGKDAYGYGLKTIYRGGGRYTQVAHRWIYEQVVGPIPQDMTLDHVCQQTSCVNPTHCEPVTFAENRKRAAAVKRIKDRARTHCYRGHVAEWAEQRDGNLYCRACKRDDARKRRER